MKRVRTLLAAAALGIMAVSAFGTGRAPKATAARQHSQARASVAAAPSPRAQASDTQANKSAATESQGPRSDSPAAKGVPLVVGVVDTSPSMKKLLDSARRTAAEFIRRAPPQAAVAVVGINDEADKSPIYTPERRAEAAEFIGGLKVGGHFTDLGRGTDAALALIQEAAPSQAVLVYFTDGQLRVPANFKHKQGFLDLLRQEFGERRANVQVIVVSFGAAQAVAPTDLPANIRVVPVGSEADLQQALENVLTPTLAERLSPPVAPAATETPGSNVNAESRPRVGWPLAAVGMLAFLCVVGAAALLMLRRRRSRARKATQEGFAEEQVENILRQDDLSGREDETAAGPVALLNIIRPSTRRGEVDFSRREALRAAEAVTVGGSEFTGISLPGLIQPETLRVSFDGASCRVARLRPRVSGELDRVELNGEPAPIQFELAPGDELSVGDFNVSLMLASEGGAGLLDAGASGGASAQRIARGRRTLRVAAAKGDYDGRV